MARQVKREFWEHFCVNTDDESKACCKICKEHFSGYIEHMHTAHLSYSGIVGIIISLFPISESVVSGAPEPVPQVPRPPDQCLTKCLFKIHSVQ